MVIFNLVSKDVDWLIPDRTLPVQRPGSKEAGDPLLDSPLRSPGTELLSPLPALVSSSSPLMSPLPLLMSPLPSLMSPLPLLMSPLPSLMSPYSAASNHDLFNLLSGSGLNLRISGEVENTPGEVR